MLSVEHCDAKFVNLNVRARKLYGLVQQEVRITLTPPKTQEPAGQTNIT